MSAKENAHSAAATTEQAAGDNAGRKIPQYDYTAGAGPISRLLSHGRVNAVPLRHLTAMTKLDGRTVRAMIAAERLAGTPILSDNSTGYYLPGDDAEKVKFIRSMRHRAREIERAAEAIEKARETE